MYNASNLYLFFGRVSVDTQVGVVRSVNVFGCGRVLPNSTPPLLILLQLIIVVDSIFVEVIKLAEVNVD